MKGRWYPTSPHHLPAHAQRRVRPAPDGGRREQRADRRARVLRPSRSGSAQGRARRCGSRASSPASTAACARFADARARTSGRCAPTASPTTPTRWRRRRTLGPRPPTGRRSASSASSPACSRSCTAAGGPARAAALPHRVRLRDQPAGSARRGPARPTRATSATPPISAGASARCGCSRSSCSRTSGRTRAGQGSPRARWHNYQTGLFHHDGARKRDVLAGLPAAVPRGGGPRAGRSPRGAGLRPGAAPRAASSGWSSSAWRPRGGWETEASLPAIAVPGREDCGDFLTDRQGFYARLLLFRGTSATGRCGGEATGGWRARPRWTSA